MTPDPDRIVRCREGNTPARKARLVAAMLQVRSITAAARAAGVGRRTATRWKLDPEFQAALSRARARLVSEAAIHALASVGPTLSRLRAIALRRGRPSMTQIRAIRTLLGIGFDGMVGGDSEVSDRELAESAGEAASSEMPVCRHGRLEPWRDPDGRHKCLDCWQYVYRPRGR